MQKRRLIAAILTFVLIAGVLPAGIYADEITVNPSHNETSPAVTVITDISMPLLNGKIDMIDSLDTYASASLWSPSFNVADISAAASFTEYPFDPLEGSRCLRVVSSDADASSWRYINYDLAAPLDLSDYNNFFYAVNIPHLSEGISKTALMIYSSDGKVFNVIAGLTTESWNGVFADISAFEGRSEITRIRIGVQHSYGQQVNYPYSFQIDCLAASHDRFLARSVRFMSGSYLVYGGESSLAYMYNPMRIDISIASTLASKCFIESNILVKENFVSANTISIRLANESSCSSITMEYATSVSPVYTDNEPVTVNITGGTAITAYYFQLPAGEVTQVKFTFNGASEGNIHIYSITPVEYYTPLSREYASLTGTQGTVTSCRLTDGGRKIFISGTLTEAGVNRYSNSRIELYELESWQSNEYIFDSESKPIATTGVSSQFSFEISSADKNRSLIHSKFIVVIYNKDKKQTIMLDNPHYITNPEITALSSLQNTDISIKGLTGSVPVLAEAGVSQTAVEVNIAEMFAEPGSSAAYMFEEEEYYFNTAYIEALDKQLNDLYIAGISAVLVMTLTGLENAAYAAPLIHRDAVIRTLNDSYAFNTDTAEGIAYLRAVCDFMSRRYMTDETNRRCVIGITVGSNIDSAYINYNMGKKTLAAFADSYSRTFRIVYNTVRAVNSNIRVYISIGSSWDKCLSTVPSYSYCGRDLLDIISEQLRREGNIAWHLAVNPYPLYSNGLTDWKTAAPEIRSNITVNSLASLCITLKRDRFLYENSSRQILLISSAGTYNDGIDADRRTAEYIAAYYTVSSESCAAVNGFIVSDNPIYKSSKFNFYKIFKYIDTDRAAEFTGFAKDILGISEWNEIISDYRSGANARRLLFENAFSDNLPDMVTGTVSLYNFENAESINVWTGSSPLVSMSAPNSFKGYRNMLFAKYGIMTQDSLCAVAGIFEYKRDLSFAPYLSFNIYTDNLPDALRTLTLTVTVSSDGSFIESKGTLRGGMWSYVVCDFSDFSAIKNVKSISIRLTAPGGDDLSGVTLVIGEIFVSSLKHDNTYLENKFKEEREKYLAANSITKNSLMIWILIGIIASATVIEFINISNRLRIIDETNKKNEKKYKYKF
ncbi:MAG: DUF5722 domain-containing protein [Eubacteriales bacterium]